METAKDNLSQMKVFKFVKFVFKFPFLGLCACNFPWANSTALLVMSVICQPCYRLFKMHR